MTGAKVGKPLVDAIRVPMVQPSLPPSPPHCKRRRWFNLIRAASPHTDCLDCGLRATPGRQSPSITVIPPLLGFSSPMAAWPPRALVSGPLATLLQGGLSTSFLISRCDLKIGDVTTHEAMTPRCGSVGGAEPSPAAPAPERALRRALQPDSGLAAAGLRPGCWVGSDVVAGAGWRSSGAAFLFRHAAHVVIPNLRAFTHAIG